MTEVAPPKACISCVHCKGSDIFLCCHHPDYSYKTKDYIQGAVYECGKHDAINKAKLAIPKLLDEQRYD
jgi:hypothetical protein